LPQHRSALGRAAFAVSVLLATGAIAQSRPSTEMFKAQDVVDGIEISHARCRLLQTEETAVWVEVRGKGYCLRYYAYGLKERTNTLAVGWINGDVVGSSGKHAGHQDGLGVAAMVAQERELSERYGQPFVFLPKPGTYGSAGKTFNLTHTRLEAEIMEAELKAVTRRYGIRNWVLGGHSAGATLVAQLLAERSDIRCAVISSGVGAMREWRLYGENAPVPDIDALMDPIADVPRIRPAGGLRVFVMADPRDKIAMWWVQEKYFAALRKARIEAELVSLEKAQPPTWHSLVTLAEAALGECARGTSSPAIIDRLNGMADQETRISN